MAAPPTATPVTFAKDVLPVLQKNCQVCHRPGEVAPMSLLTYKEARPWAKAMKDAVLQKKMPPWTADPRYGHFSNERRLTDAEINTLVSWADSGAPEGNAKDAPTPLQFHEGWNIRPDVIVEMPYDVPVQATGTIDYTTVVVKADFKEDMWVRAAEVRPGNRQVVHHLRIYIRPPGSTQYDGMPFGVPFTSANAPRRAAANKSAPAQSERQGIFVKWNPGLDMETFDVDGAAKFIPKGSDVVFSIHYTASGKPATDRSKVGFELAKAPPRSRYEINESLATSRFVIPAGDSNAEVRQEITVQRDTRLVWMQPHMHLRGKDYEVQAVYPSGETEVLLKAKFDFDWQFGYELAKPVMLPKGTKLIGIAHYDNSASNKFNPDSTIDVHPGLQNWDEMMGCFLGVIVDPSTDARTLFRVPNAALPAGTLD
jgi:hypothetical protein